MLLTTAAVYRLHLPVKSLCLALIFTHVADFPKSLTPPALFFLLPQVFVCTCWGFDPGTLLNS